MAIINEHIKARRTALELTLEDVAKFVGVSRQTIQRYESGVISTIPSDKIEKLSVVLKTTPAYLMGWEDETKTAETAPPGFTLVPLTDHEHSLVNKYRALSPQGRIPVDAVLDAQYQQSLPHIKEEKETS